MRDSSVAGVWKRAALAIGLCAGLLAGCATRSAVVNAPPHAVVSVQHDAAPRNGSAGLQFPGVTAMQLQAAYWIARTPAADVLRLDAPGVAALNAEQFARDPTFHRMEALPATLTGSEVRGWIEGLSKRPTSPLLLGDGSTLPPQRIDAWMAALALDAISAQVTPTWAVVTARADLRTFPTSERVYRDQTGIRERIDRFQESALFPGTPVAVLHSSHDGEWVYVVSPTYRAWMRRDHLGFASRDQVLGFAAAATHRVIAPRVLMDGRAFDMSTPLRIAANGQVVVPKRGTGGRLESIPATPPSAEMLVSGALPYTERNLLNQAFQLLGEPYGWGHADGTRDCSGFVSDVYRSLGVQLARNTGDQRDSPVLQTTRFSEATPRAERLAVLAQARPGDLIFIPGHVMMVIGHVEGVTYVIHDTPGARVMADAGGLQHLPLDGVSVTPLQALRVDETRDFLDIARAIQRVMPKGK